MSVSAAWALVAASFLLLGLFGYASVSRSKAGMVFGAVIILETEIEPQIDADSRR